MQPLSVQNCSDSPFLVWKEEGLVDGEWRHLLTSSLLAQFVHCLAAFVDGSLPAFQAGASGNLMHLPEEGSQK
jgi:hypothetical protein